MFVFFKGGRTQNDLPIKHLIWGLDSIMNTTYELNIGNEQETESNRLTTKCDHANLLYANEIEFRWVLHPH